jgi:hypothetical protein
MSPKDGRAEEISQRRDQIARSFVDVLLNGQSPSNHARRFPAAMAVLIAKAITEGDELLEATCDRRAPVFSGVALRTEAPAGCIGPEAGSRAPLRAMQRGRRAVHSHAQN